MIPDQSKSRTIDDLNARSWEAMIRSPLEAGSLAEAEEIERFFESEWFALLCDINPEYTKIHLQEARA